MKKYIATLVVVMTAPVLMAPGAGSCPNCTLQGSEKQTAVVTQAWEQRDLREPLFPEDTRRPVAITLDINDGQSYLVLGFDGCCGTLVFSYSISTLEAQPFAKDFADTMVRLGSDGRTTIMAGSFRVPIPIGPGPIGTGVPPDSRLVDIAQRSAVMISEVNESMLRELDALE